MSANFEPTTTGVACKLGPVAGIEQPTITVAAGPAADVLHYRVEGAHVDGRYWKPSRGTGDTPWCEFSLAIGAVELSSGGAAGNVLPPGWPVLFEETDAPSVRFGLTMVGRSLFRILEAAYAVRARDDEIARAHRALVHPNGGRCPDGCGGA